jgi:hypothetical protein
MKFGESHRTFELFEQFDVQPKNEDFAAYGVLTYPKHACSLEYM